MVGVGSVGTRCYIMLMLCRDHGDPLFLQVKEAQPSVLERFLGPAGYAHHGERVVAGQRLMQAATDIFRAHARWGDRIAIASYLGQGDAFDRAVADFSAVYAGQNERDYAMFAAAVNSGRLAARTGV